MGEWRKRVTRAFAAGERFVDYQRAPRWAEGVHDVLDELQRLLDAGDAHAVLTLAEHAHRRAETALNRIDDSAGWLTDISRRIAELHRAAAAHASPSPRPFAKRLFDLETSSHTLDTFHRAAAVYADVLGAESIARYRQLVDDAWEAADHTGPRWDNFRLQQARIAVAIAAADPDELIAVKHDDLHSSYDYLEIAQALADAGRVDDAIDWARRGLDTHADRWHQTPKLRDWLAQILTDHGRSDETEGLYWDAFVRHPTLGGYRHLVDHATEPDDASSKAIAYLEDRVGTPLGGGHLFPADVLIEILAHEGDHDCAWALYQQHGCTHDLAMRLAKRRESDHPLDAIDVYVLDVERHIDHKNKTGYRAAVRQLTHIRDLAEHAGRPDVAADIIEYVRTEHRLKRTLMALLDKARLDDA